MSVSVVMVTADHLSNRETVSEVVEWVVSIVFMDLQLREEEKGRGRERRKERGKGVQREMKIQ